MLHCYYILLSLLLIRLSSALVPILQAPQNLTISPGDCHDAQDSSQAFITFQNDSDTRFQLAIKTSYHIYYPRVLAHALLADKFALLYLPPDQKCGWLRAKSVYTKHWSDMGRHRGDIYWRYADLRWVDLPHNANITSHWVANSESHVPPRTNELPSNQTIDRISRVLKYNKPAGDVFEIRTICLGYFCGFLAVVLCMVLVHRYLGSEAPPDQQDSSAVIELRRILIADQGKRQSTNMVDVTARAENDPPSYTARTRNREHSEPLPLYSEDRSGR